MDSTPEVARTDLGAFIRQLKSFRLSMPPQHRDLVARFESQGNLPEFIAALEEHVLKLNTTKPIVAQLKEQLANVKTRFNQCIETLTAFRKIHMDFAVKYIKTMALKRTDAGQAGVKGTGGSDYAKHLGQHITDTRKSLYMVHPQVLPSPSLQLQSSSSSAGNVSPRLALGSSTGESSAVLHKLKKLQLT
jgi:hypothetical protein